MILSYYVQINKLAGNEDVNLPCKMSEQASGYDLYAAVESEVVLAPGERALISTGISLAMPDGLEAQIRPRSGLALKHGITCLNTPGTIDADYRGEIKVLLINLGQEPFAIARNERIAQMVFQAVPVVTLVEVDTLSETERGAGGFGHTGK
ncbi:deoxyuridine 5'-triphosphate nucleotidohydrolase [Paenibacillus sp. VTT E-133280]|nr:deoxyuridine 5'-triphosphate nucleotidohydrolase [Paenibacillus sp. VTT E-133280]